MISLRIIFALVLLLGVTLAFSSYRDAIPNGRSVPHPCLKGETWPGVGHNARFGSGDRNPFGMDYYNSDFKWADICNKDSDGDGKTNGEELGDPNCVWSKGMTPQRAASSHPGVCEPVDSPKCMSRNKWDVPDC